MNAGNASSLRADPGCGSPALQGRQGQAQGVILGKSRRVQGIVEPSRGNLVRLALLVLALAATPRAEGQAPVASRPTALPTAAQLEQLKQRNDLDPKAEALAGRGNLAEAIAVGRKKLAIEREALGETHDDVIATLQQLARWQMGREEFDTARKDCLEVLDIQIKRHGEQDWRVADARRALANLGQLAQMSPDRRRKVAEAERLDAQVKILTKQGNFPEAETLCRTALIHRKEVLGKQHPDSMASLNSLGWLLLNRGDLDGGLDNFKQALELGEQIYPVDKYPQGHFNRAASLNGLGAVLYYRGDYDAALDYFQKSLAMWERLYPTDQYPLGHPLLAKGLTNLGLVLEARHDPDAVVYARKSLAMWRRLYPADQYPLGHPDLATCLSNLGVVLEGQGDFDVALDSYQKALAMRERLYPADQYPLGHHLLATSLHNLGVVFRERGDLDAALDYAKRALAMRERLYPANQYPNGHPDLAVGLYSLGRIFTDRGDYAAALDYSKKALAMRERLYPANQYPNGHPLLAASLFMLSLVQEKRGDSDSALVYAKQALAMEERLYPADRYPLGHPDLTGRLDHLGFLLAKRGDLDGAWDHLARALRMEQDLVDTVASSASEAEALRYAAASTPQTRDKLLSVALRRTTSGDDLYAHIWRTKAAITRIVQLRQHHWATRADASTRDLVRKYQDTRRNLGREYRASADAPAKSEERARRLRALTERKEQLERQLAQQLPEFKRELELARRPFTDLIERLPNRVVFLDLLRYTDTEQDPQVAGAKGERRIPRYVGLILARGRPVARQD
jgi:tetratricopeptide (TPR) repeat protein